MQSRLESGAEGPFGQELVEMWYFAKVQLLPGVEQQLRRELLWGESHLPQGMIGLVPAESEVGYLFGWCHSMSEVACRGELEDLRKYFKILEFGPAEPFFVGEHAPAIFSTQLSVGKLAFPVA